MLVPYNALIKIFNVLHYMVDNFQGFSDFLLHLRVNTPGKQNVLKTRPTSCLGLEPCMFIVSLAMQLTVVCVHFV